MSQVTSNSSRFNLRAQVVQTLLKVQQGQSLASILNTQLNQVAERDRALFHELVLGTLRQWFALKSISLPLLSKPLNNETVETCLYVGLYQVLCTRIAAHAAISETVDATKQLGFPALSGIVNAILRRATRETEDFQQGLQQAHGLPSWLFKRLKKDWGEQTETLCQSLKQAAPLTLRVNQRHIGRDAYLAKLQSLDIQARACLFSEAGIVLEQSIQITQLPGFEQGWFSVQDEHAQLCATLLPDLNNKTVIDACAAPGGKTAHLLEKFKPAQLIAIDQDPSRLVRVTENLNRLALDQSHTEILAADATKWTLAQPVDCIVLDAPCSATGVIRRHPDIRLLRQSSDIAQTIELQKQILEHMWQQLKVGGTLLYITCSILKAENEQQMTSFFAKHTDAKEVKIEADWGIEQTHGRQLLPEAQSGDGFYYCKIQKIA
ncbi:16S rRNA (cytosine(967)-C(5))-methyltransferase RsmB [Acinetobacter nosocomialis]|uniref:16S rRNA (cytosine(967)-C(5))-methyltransferase RsmB n=1 Tax=Acinetobacter nosocomialis TaxID=106654 RepID=UPI000DE6279F|nr:16S rRNA (cytosine(967)-C(5))-methyltransferase RsmB [Acinetobacter nosocomialis]SSV71817.1 16S rRNA m5C967 SAM-dependent methyltransferase [Acinetobacter nosocomialis]HAV16898.1 16S rRNA (cytosine(967)-C(5))-methyltransferase RsmB [Acinetobacter nosocomialis]HCD62695.1 16S rRNA (cytosine(967)-C(5))-methyltransferase RsmB [Acinetobacter nosocomialis]